MIETHDIQHILLARAPALTGRYEFLSFRDGAGARAWLSQILKTVQSAEAMQATVDQNKRWVTVAFTWNGLRALRDQRSFARHVSGGVSARHGRAGLHSRRCG
jgi:hypothetical protein